MQILYSLYLMRPNGQDLTKIVERGAYPVWSPDGQRIAFVWNGIWVVNRDGTLPVLLTGSQSPDQQFEFSPPSWSPDGMQLLFSSNESGATEVYVVSADGQSRMSLSRDWKLRARQPVWSPDGSKIAFYLFKDRQHRVCVMNPDGVRPASCGNA